MNLPFLTSLAFLLTTVSLFSQEFFDIDFRDLRSSREDFPDWIGEISEEGGQFDPNEGWKVDDSQSFGVGKILISLDRTTAPNHVALTMISSSLSSLAVQLVDREERVVAVDLLATRQETPQGKSVLTVAIPLIEFPTAEKIVIRRLEGQTNLTYCSVIPLSKSIPQTTEILRDLASELGDPLSPSNPLVSGVTQAIQGTDEETTPVILFDEYQQSEVISPISDLSSDSPDEKLSESDLLTIFQVLGLQGLEFNAKDFVKAAGEDRAEIVDLYLRAGMPIDSIGATHYTAAAEAANSGALRTLRFLSEKGADLEIKTAGGNTPLWLACMNNDFEAVRLLVKHGADVNTVGAYGNSAIIQSWASRASDKEAAYSIVLFLLENGADPDIPTDEGKTLLHKAATAYTPFYKQILPYSDNLDAVDNFGFTPMMRAVYWNDRGNTRELKAAGAQEWTPEFKTKEEELAFRITRRDWNEANELLEEGVSPDALEIEGYPVIFRVIDWRNTYGVEKLVEYGANLDVRDDNGQSLLGRVAGTYHPKREAMVDLLLSLGLDPNYPTQEELKRKKPYFTPLMRAAFKGNSIRCRVLVEAGADPTVRNLPNRTAAIIAERAGHLQLAAELRAAEEEWNAKSDEDSDEASFL